MAANGNGRVDARHDGLVVDRLSAGYGERRVVENVGFHALPGEVLAILGRNGAGKSTVLLAIAGFLSQVEGSLRLDGRELSGSAHQRSREALGIVIKGRSLFPSLTVSENLELADVAVGQAVALFPELESKAKLRAGLLSGGEQQMLAVARAILRRPRLLLLDELTFGLAPLMSARLIDVLRRATSETGAVVVVVEQHIHLAERIADHAVIMGEGRVRLSLSASELVTRSEEIERVYLGRPPDEEIAPPVALSQREVELE